MSQTYIGIIVMLLSTLLPKLGIVIGSDQLTTAASVILTLIGGIWAFYGRYRLGGITPVGTRTQ